ncbi:MAG: Nre family DNA repair protein [Candidatus Micrarchaeota archaeon]|nr:Nre family DNA repair protein [Candidatus Micrarchaeota archaeon]
MKADSSMCVVCKGSRRLCGLARCPILEKMSAQAQVGAKLSENIFGPSPPNVFVGWGGYPDVWWGPMVSVEDVPNADNPAKWYGLPLSNIVSFRSNIIRSRTRQGVRERTRLLEKAQDAILSVSPVDMEVSFKDKPKMGVTFSPVTQPMGPVGTLKDFRVCSNPVIPRRVDELAEEKFKATEAIGILNDSGFDVYYSVKLLSAGILGKSRRMVPTRWSITAIDDIVAKKLMDELRELSHLQSYEVYSSQYLENHYEILLMPGAWEFENFEAWSPKTIWTEGAKRAVVSGEYEPNYGRKTYAVSQGGGYYASRIAVAEHLKSLGRQARAVVFREIYEGYMVPVGVWQVRENVRNAFKNGAKRFSTLEEALVHVGSRLRTPMREYMSKSRIIGQSRLAEFA